MKKILFTVLLVLAMAHLASAGELDGLWAVADHPDILFTVRENQGLILLVKLNIPGWPDSPLLWEAFIGTVSGQTGTVFSTPFSATNADMAVTVNSSASLTIHVNSCEPKPEYSFVPCLFGAGSDVAMAKIF